MKMNSFEFFSKSFLPGRNLWTLQIAFFWKETSKLRDIHVLPEDSIRAAAAVGEVVAVLGEVVAAVREEEAGVEETEAGVVVAAVVVAAVVVAAVVVVAAMVAVDQAFG